MVRYSAERAAKLLDHLDFQPWHVLPRSRCVSLDGNHLEKTQKRLKETRGLCAAPLPGTVVARFDHQTWLFGQAYLLEDAHAQEATVLDRVVNDLAANDLVIADRQFCIALFQFRMAMFAYNCRQVLLAALFAEHEQEDVEAMSQHQVALDIVSPMEGMLTAIPADEWTELTPQHPEGIAIFVRDVSRHVDVHS